MSNFFLVSLPRSRSAWFANYLTFKDSFCYHDPFCDYLPQRVTEMLKENSPSNIGISDAGLILYWDQFRNTFPDAKWVVVERPFDDVMASCNRIVKADQGRMIDLRRGLDDLISELKPMLIDFDEIAPQTAMAVAEYCNVDAGNLERAEMLCDFNVQLHLPVLHKRLGKIINSME